MALAWIKGENFTETPAPVARDDDAYFEPFRDLKLDPDPRRILGGADGDGLNDRRSPRRGVRLDLRTASS